MKTSETLTLPVAAHRWLEAGEAWTFHPDLSIPEGGLDRDIVAALEQADLFRAPDPSREFEPFAIPVADGHLVGTVAADPDCPDIKGRSRRPYVLRAALAPKSLPEREYPAIQRALAEYLPTKAGVDPRAIVAIRVRAKRRMAASLRQKCLVFATVAAALLLCLTMTGGARSEPGFRITKWFMMSPRPEPPRAILRLTALHDAAAPWQIVAALNRKLDSYFDRSAPVDQSLAEAALLSRIRAINEWQRNGAPSPNSLEELFARDREVGESIASLFAAPSLSFRNLTSVRGGAERLVATRQEWELTRQLQAAIGAAQHAPLPETTSRFDPLSPVLELARRLPRVIAPENVARRENTFGAEHDGTASHTDAARIGIEARRGVEPPGGELCAWRPVDVNLAQELQRQLEAAQLGDLLEVRRFLLAAESHSQERDVAAALVAGMLVCGWGGK